jgi:hypothetical protein
MRITAAAVRVHLKKILASEAFRDTDRLKQFLQYIVSETLRGRSACLKEFPLGMDVFEKPASFDPRLDPIVRVQAGRLRAKLKEYYAMEGAEDVIQIQVPKGSYVPVFMSSEAQENSADSAAYTFYLRGRSLLGISDRVSVLEAVKCFESSIAKDPAFLLSYVGLATSYTLLAAEDVVPSNVAAGKALEAAERAHQILLT